MGNTPHNLFLIHGAFGNPQENWFPSIRLTAEELGLEVIAPTFPTPKEQSLNNWNLVFDTVRPNLNEGSILIGHSIGAAFCLRILEALDFPIHASFFVSAFSSQLGLADFDPLNASFLKAPFDWQKIKCNTKHRHVLHGSNDPYVAKSYAEEISSRADCELHWVKGGGHLNEAAGFTEFPQLVSKLKLVVA